LYIADRRFHFDDCGAEHAHVLGCDWSNCALAGFDDKEADQRSSGGSHIFSFALLTVTCRLNAHFVDTEPHPDACPRAGGRSHHDRI
jgi:hypothetical protein